MGNLICREATLARGTTGGLVGSPLCRANVEVQAKQAKRINLWFGKQI
jgi:hypothetical protein